jgi:Nif-specific regulatory protein
MTERQQLLQAELETLYQVSQVLSRSLDLKDTLNAVLKVLHDNAGLESGMVSLLEPETKGLLVTSVYGLPLQANGVRYHPGEGIVGIIMREEKSVLLRCIANEPRFLGRLGIYNPQGAFIGVPIRIAQQVVGVLTAQPVAGTEYLIAEYGRFLEVVANLIGQNVRLAWEVERKFRDLLDERDQLLRTVRGQYGFDNVIGHAKAMRQVFEQVRQVAKWNTTVLIRGETGTGKDLIASAVHYNSSRAHGPLIRLNCAALPENLLESELFGHEKGAFTGAITQRKGRFEQADGGTLFLDEIGDISPTFQAKLLRVIQGREFERVGGNRTIKVDVRIIAATHQDLEAAVAAGKFREDLYYRLNVMPIFLPPLRERMEDIPSIVQFLVNKISHQQGRELTLTDAAIRILMHHDWPGNVRELENCLERAAVMTKTTVIDRDAILLTGIEERISISHGNAQSIDLNDPNLDERERVIAALEKTGWVQAKAARLLGITPRQIAYRIQTLKIKVRQL